MMFKGRVYHYVRITRLVKSAVKLANGKATEVCRVYLVRGVTVTERDGSSWVLTMHYNPENEANTQNRIFRCLPWEDCTYCTSLHITHSEKVCAFKYVQKYPCMVIPKSNKGF